MATALNTDYLKFDAFSVKSLIKQKLSEDPTFTDYVYDGSNLSIMIDIFSNMFQVLMYNLNHSAAESMFTDTQIYENMNRLVKFIGYNPRGYTTSNIAANVQYPETSGRIQGVLLPPYSAVSLNKQTKDGVPVLYSTVNEYYLYFNDITNTNPILMYNGEWIKYASTFTAEGIPYEKFVLSQLISDATALEPTYIAYPYIHVYIKRRISETSYETIRFNPSINGLFIDTTNQIVYDSDSKIFNLRINEYKQYEIQFGDGIHGQALKAGDTIHIVYLKSSGLDGAIEGSEISSNNKLVTKITNIDAAVNNDASILTIPDILYCLFGNTPTIVNQTYTDLYVTSDATSITPVVEETVEEIKTNAPQWFKTFGRVITQKDFEYYIKSNYYNDVVDIKVMNNWEYISTFYKWLYIQGMNAKTTASAIKYINNNLSTNYAYKYSDAADSNNVYLWIKTRNDSSDLSTSLFQTLDEVLRPIKPLTAETIFLTPIRKQFFPCVRVNSDNLANYSITNWDPLIENYIEVEVDKNSSFAFNSIRNTIAAYIIDYFSIARQKMGNSINLLDLTSQILSISGIKTLKTVYVKATEIDSTISIDGLSFACWTPDIINGEDQAFTNTSMVLEPFQFAELAFPTTLVDHIKIITSSVYTTNQIEY